MSKRIFFILIVLFFCAGVQAQKKSFIIGVNGDTLNVTDENGLKQGRWVFRVEPLRGEPGYDEQGIFVDDKKEGVWSRFSLMGDLLATETYFKGGKDGLSRYFTQFGALVREENWRGYNPDAPYDTIPVYGQGNNEIIDYKIVKAVPYSVKHGKWTYYNPQTGMIVKTERYDRNRLLDSPFAGVTAQQEKPDTLKKVKPAEVLEWEKKNSGKKKVRVRQGQTGM